MSRSNTTCLENLKSIEPPNAAWLTILFSLINHAESNASFKKKNQLTSSAEVVGRVQEISDLKRNPTELISAIDLR